MEQPAIGASPHGIGTPAAPPGTLIRVARLACQVGFVVLLPRPACGERVALRRVRGSFSGCRGLSPRRPRSPSGCPGLLVKPGLQIPRILQHPAAPTAREGVAFFPLPAPRGERVVAQRPGEGPLSVFFSHIILLSVLSVSSVVEFLTPTPTSHPHTNRTDTPPAPPPHKSPAHAQPPPETTPPPAPSTSTSANENSSTTHLST